VKNFLDRLKSRDSDIQSSAYHSPSYHKYFEGTSEVLTTGVDGKSKKIVRVYTGLYYSQDMPGRQRILNRLLFAGLYIGSAVLFIFCASIKNMGNRTWFIAIPEALSFFGFFMMFYVLLNYMTTPREMTAGCFRSTSGPLIKSSRLTASALGLLTLAQLIYTLFFIKENRIYGIRSAIGFFFSCIAIYAIGFSESRITYKRTRSKNNIPDNGIEIDR
jgi:hypothetical protein